MRHSENGIDSGTLVEPIDEVQLDLFSLVELAAAVVTTRPIGLGPMGSRGRLVGDEVDTDRRTDDASVSAMDRSSTACDNNRDDLRRLRDDRRLAKARARTRRATMALVAHLEKLTRNPNDGLAESALTVLTLVKSSPTPLNARTFDQVYFEVRRQISRIDEHKRREWRGVEGLTVALFHALLHQFRRDVTRRTDARIQPWQIFTHLSSRQGRCDDAIVHACSKNRAANDGRVHTRYGDADAGHERRRISHSTEAVPNEVKDRHRKSYHADGPESVCEPTQVKRA